MLKSQIELNIVLNTISLRKSKKKTQREIATILNTSAGFIGQVESKNSPTMYTYNQLNRLAVAFNCSPKDFMPEQPIRETIIIIDKEM